MGKKEKGEKKEAQDKPNHFLADKITEHLSGRPLSAKPPVDPEQMLSYQQFE
jgi:hypothetical protein